MSQFDSNKEQIGVPLDSVAQANIIMLRNQYKTLMMITVRVSDADKLENIQTTTGTK